MRFRVLIALLIVSVYCLAEELIIRDTAMIESEYAASAFDEVEALVACQRADSMIAYATNYIGVLYHRGSNSEKTFDCSGFTSYVYKRFGYELPRTSQAQGAYGRAVPKDFRNMQKGDLVLFRGRKNAGIGHVGIFIGLDDSLGSSFSFIHASVQNGVIVSHYSEPYYRTRYRFSRRVLPDFERNPKELSPDSLIINSFFQDSAFSVPAISPELESVFHYVRKGDTLYAISRRYGCSVKHLCSINHIRENSTLQIGQRLRVK